MHVRMHSTALALMRRALESGNEVAELRARVEDFAGSFAMPGFDVTAIEHGASSNGLVNGHHSTLADKPPYATATPAQ